ncbi:MAG: ATP-binding protein [Polyangiaceae bacterium]|nr:ATP-binding protein [Polyangiaceae bacterium]
MTPDEALSLDQLAIEQKFELEDLLDKGSLGEMCRSFESLFELPVRIYSSSGALLADTQGVPSLYRYLEKAKAGRRAVQDVATGVRRAEPLPGAPVLIEGVPGVLYQASLIEHEGRSLGRIILGPYTDDSQNEPPAALFDLVEELAGEGIAQEWANLPSLSSLAIGRLERHLRATLELLLFSGLKAHMASHMHMASVRESFRELSERNQKLKDAYERLKELDRLKSNFLATVSHELRTPLTSIIGYSEMLLEGIAGEVQEEQKEFVETIHEKGEQLLELIKSLLDLSKLESGTMSLHKVATTGDAIVKDVVSTLTPTAHKKGVYLLSASEADLPPMLADPERMRQVLINLTENALKFTPKGGSVTLSAVHKKEAASDMGGGGSVLMGAVRRSVIEFSVADTGIGISDAEKKRVFDAFYQVDSSSTREAGGTGLGLSIVQRLVDGHDGKISIEDNDPQGSVFIVTVPLKKPPTT